MRTLRRIWASCVSRHPVAVLGAIFYGLMFPWFVLFVLDPVFTQTDCYAQDYAAPACWHQLQDISRYFATAREANILEMLGIDGDLARRNTLGLTNISIFVMIQAAYTVSPGAPQFAIYMFNLAFLVILYYMVDALIVYWRVRRGWLVHATVLFNPLMASAVTGPTKEFWCVWFSVFLVLLALRQRWVVLLAVAVVAAMFREVLLLVGAFLAVSFFLRVHALWCWIGVSLLISAIDLSNIAPAFTVWRLNSSNWLGQASAPLMYAAGVLQGIPLGLIPANLAIFAVNASNPMLSPDFYAGIGLGVWNASNFVSSVLTMALCTAWAMRPDRIVQLWNSDLAQVILVLLLTCTLAPISQHRYLLPLLPFLAIGLLAADAPAQYFFAPHRIIRGWIGKNPTGT